MNTKNRNYSVDFIRGILVISIIFIHTTFWSGQLYLPYKISNISLLFDVPVFMFIAGIAFHFSNNIMKLLKGVLKLILKYWYFLVIYSLILIFFFRDQFLVKYLFDWIAFSFPQSNDLMVVGGSIWFMPMYLRVTLFCGVLICANNYFSKNKNLSLITILLFIIYIYIYSQHSGNFIFIDIQLAMYSIYFILGYLSFSIKIKNWKYFLIIELLILMGFIFICHYFGYTIVDLQGAKGICGLLYFIYSLFSIFIVWYLKDRINIKKSNLIAKIGKSAIFFYFAQGISSSLIYKIIDFINIDAWYYKLPIMFVINLSMALIIGFLLILGYDLLSKIKISKKIKNVVNPFLTNN